MTRWIAFLRAVNVGGHTVKMETLREIFTAAGLARVETFIASGNVIFEAEDGFHLDLKAHIESHLRENLGYQVDVFLRTATEVAAIAAYQPFSPLMLEKAAALNIAFLSAPVDDLSQVKLQAFTTDIDYFHAQRGEVYWLCLKKQSESTFSNAVLEKTLGVRSTIRGINTILKLAGKYPPD